MPEAEQQVYLEMVQELLNCPQGQESELLATKPELVNEQLIETLLLVAEMLEQEGEDNAPWLRGFAQNLAGALGLELGGVEDEGEADSEDYSQADLDFLNTLIAAERGDSSQVQQLFAENLQRLTPQLGAIMKWYMAQIIEQQPENAEYYAAWIENIAIKLSNFPLGNRAQNLEIVIAGYAAVLTARTKENNPEKWAQTQNNLAIAYNERIRGDQAENLEQSIACHTLALEIRTKADLPIGWANTQNNLAIAYSDRIRGDRAENLEQSIACYTLALEIRTKADLPIDWAGTQHNLAIAYNNRIRGDKAENLEVSIACYKSALEIYTKQDLPINWAMTHNSLANAYQKRIRGDKAENLERSITCYTLALEIRTKADLPIDWAGTQHNLAIAYNNRIRGDKAENLEVSIACYKSALEIYTKQDLPINWAMTHNSLANAYQDRIRGDKAENLEQSIACYQSALEIYTPQDLPIECLGTARNLGNLHFYEENWQEAIDPYILAITAVELSRSWATSEQSKQEIIAQAISVYFNLVECCINTQQYAKALEYAERSKSRNLVELLATRDLYPKGDIPAEILSQLDNLRRQVLAEERRLGQSGGAGGSGETGGGWESEDWECEFPPRRQRSSATD